MTYNQPVTTRRTMVNYELRLRAIGRLIDSAMLRDLCLMEFEHGILVVGLAPVDSPDDTTIQPKSIEFDNATIERTALEFSHSVLGNGAPGVSHQPDPPARGTPSE